MQAQSLSINDTYNSLAVDTSLVGKGTEAGNRVVEGDID